MSRLTEALIVNIRATDHATSALRSLVQTLWLLKLTQNTRSFMRAHRVREASAKGLSLRWAPTVYQRPEPDPIQRDERLERLLRGEK